MAELDSVNIGQPEAISSKSGKTGIFKRPVSGPVEITAQGLAGDAVIDRRHHGGVDQAVYVYFADDYDWWSTQLGETIAPGTFGDNLTIAGVDGRAVAVGDRFAIGSCVIEVTSQRTPCSTLAARMDDPKFLKRFHRAGRPGAYCRVIEEGSVRAGEPVDYQMFDGPRTSVAELLALEGRREIAPAVIERALAAPLHYKLREDFEARRARLF